MRLGISMQNEIINALGTIERSVKRIRKLLSRAINLAESPAPNYANIMEVIDLLEKNLRQTKLDEFFQKDIVNKIVATVKSIKEEVSKSKEQFKEIFVKQLKSELEAHGFELNGHFPEFKVLFYTIEIDTSRNMARIWYGPKQELLKKVYPLDPAKIARTLKQFHERITKKRFESDDEFLSKLFDAYKIVITRNNRNIGDDVPICDVMLSLAVLIQDKRFKIDPQKSNFRSYGRVYFSYDLYRLKKRKIQGYELLLVTATRSDTIRKSGFLWIPTSERGDGRYISRIKFRRVISNVEPSE